MPRAHHLGGELVAQHRREKPRDVADHAQRQALGDTVFDQMQKSERPGHLAQVAA